MTAMNKKLVIPVSTQMNELRKRVGKTLDECRETRTYFHQLLEDNRKFMESAKQFLEQARQR